jgi:hypothetical protein
VVRRDVPLPAARVVLRAGGDFAPVAFAPFVAFVVVRLVGVFGVSDVSAALVRRVPLARLVVFDSSGMTPLLVYVHNVPMSA